jgi:hypothetical protein
VVAPTLFAAATLGHFALIACWLRVLCPQLAGRDEFAFHAAVVGLGSFQAILHTVAFTAGLSLDRGLTAFALVHLLAGLWVWRVVRRRIDDRRTANEGEDAAARGGPAGLLRLGGFLVVSALAAQWGMAATRSLFITGADAVHYHVPYAVNIALGAIPFGPTATPHLYPMGTSVTAAWFILPFRDPMLVDLAVLPAFLLAWFAVGRLVGLLTGHGDLAWGPWCALLLFSTPLFRASLLMSADLFYAAAFLSVNALLLQAYARSRVTAVDLLSLGFASGMLLSAKVTGAFSAVLLFALYGAAIVLRRVASGRRLQRQGSWAWAVAAVVAVASGGIWLARNWWAFGSPLAPAGFAIFGVEIFPGEKYRDAKFLVSVLKDMRDEPGYAVLERLWYWMSQWLGAWFVLAGVVVAVAFVLRSLLAARTREGRDPAGEARVTFVIASGIAILAHGILLAGVQWSSLEWTKGFSLRYLLPCLALYMVATYGSAVSLVGRLTAARPVIAVGLPALSVSWYLAHQATGGGPPGEAPACFEAAGAAVGAALVLVTVVCRRLGPRGRLAVCATVLAAVSAAYGANGAADDARLVAAATTELESALAEHQRDRNRPGGYRDTYLALLDYERSAGVACARRRIYTTTRWDYPLELQSARFDNMVFDVRGASFNRRLLAWAQPGRACDYVIADAPTLDTDRGVLLINLLKPRQALRRAAANGRHVVFAVR